MAEDVQKLTEKQVRERLALGDVDMEFLDACRSDSRAGVRRLAGVHDRRQMREEAEQQRLQNILAFERQQAERGYSRIAGVDEVGRGPLAGPVVAACVILPLEDPIQGINDSKQLSPKKREELAEVIRSRALGVGIAPIESQEIDRINIRQASIRAMADAVESCGPAAPDFLLIDAMRLPDLPMPQLSMVHGDERSYLIGAASIVAKVHRDRLMVELDSAYPGYAFASNKGYGTADHMDGLERLGPCDIHRRSFAPVAAYSLPSCRLFLEAIGRASSAAALRVTGERIRDTGTHLTEEERDTLREAYRVRQEQLGGC